MILIDTHVIIWMAKGDAQLGQKCRTDLDRYRDDGALAFSAISFWEIGLLIAKGRLSFRQTAGDLRRDFLTGGASEIPLNGEIAIAAAGLDLHGDPADRFIVATAMAHGATLVTADKALLKWRGKLARQDATR